MPLDYQLHIHLFIISHVVKDILILVNRPKSPPDVIFGPISKFKKIVIITTLGIKVH